MPFAVYMLGLAVFAQGTSEFMLSGLAPDIAADLDVSVAATGALTSAFAMGMIAGAPLMAVLSLRWPRRRALLVFLAVFVAAHVVGALTSDFGVLLATRVVGALANAGFIAVGMATATGLVPADAKGRAVSVLVSGITLSIVAGVPAGAVLGQLWGWRAAFWAVALICLPVVLAIVRSIPGGRPGTDGSAESPAGTGGAVGAVGGAGVPSARRELRALRRPRLLVTLAVAALMNAATFATFAYLAPVMTDVAGFAEHWMPVVLVAFGVGAFAGVTVSGRTADRRPMRLLVPGGAGLLAGWSVFALSAGYGPAALVLVLVLGLLSFAVGSTLITLAVYAAPEAPTLGGSYATAALNAGAAIGPGVAGAAIGAGLGYRSAPWSSAALVALALVVAGAARTVAARRTGAAPAESRPQHRPV
ncbi:Cmx/CmrA family chloramphenicol efflux MFS transporter [Streptomyces sp. NPDC020875]|uniref:Cmx/CmrA family chloramphenicol efflux MFS transporter n=1 Tax=Streptomyces sp. NPDC020875 TaxID=3154898 RepID=UPI0033F1C025